MKIWVAQDLEGKDGNMYGSILRVDLTRETITKEPIPSAWCRKYLGGSGINARLLWEHFLKVDPKADPLGSDNVLISGLGPLGATGLGAGSKTKWTFKSPLTNMYGDTSCGGFLSGQLRWAGYDHVVITGRAKRPVYLRIDDDLVEIRDAGKVWGKDITETEDAIKMELGQGDAEMVSIGRAGENLVGCASIVASRHGVGARTGGGAVFGSKNLKAIAARGTKGIRIYDPQAFLEAVDAVVAGLEKTRIAIVERKVFGTLLHIRRLHLLGFNPYRNGQGRMIPEEAIGRLDASWYMDNLAQRTSVSCSPGCVITCCARYRIKGNESPAAAKYAGETGNRPEYGGWSPFAANCAVLDLPAVFHLNKVCRECGVDTMEMGAKIAFLMELWERGIITEEDVTAWMGEPLSLEWGNDEAIEKIIEAVASQKNQLGKMLRGSVLQAAKAVEERKEVPVVKYAQYGKGGIGHSETERAWQTMVTGLAVSSLGGHHSKGFGLSEEAAQFYLGTREAGKMLSPSLTLKGAALAISEITSAFVNALGICRFLIGAYGWDPHNVPPELPAKAVSAATGVTFSGDDLHAAGERIVNLEKAFNSRLGLKRDDDTLCERWLKEPLLEGAAKGMKAEDFLEQIKDEYYEYRGWDKKMALQTRKKLEQLDMKDVAQVLEEEGALV